MWEKENSCFVITLVPVLINKIVTNIRNIFKQVLDHTGFLCKLNV